MLLSESRFKKVAGLQACNFIKNRPQHRCFPVKIAKFLRLPILKNICECFDAYCYMGLKVRSLDCMMASGFRVRVTVLVFCFQVSISHP